MGWTWTYNLIDKKQIIEEVTRDNTFYKFLKKAVYNNSLWTLWLNINTQQKEIVLFILSKRNGSWGYKNISEIEYRFYYDCPLSFLKEAKVTCMEWRNHVYSYHKQESKRKELLKKIDIGDIVKIRDCNLTEFEIIKIKPLLGKSIKNGKYYKLIKSRII